VYLNTNFKDSYTVKVYDIKGSIVKQFQKNDSEFVVQLRDFESGMYILEITTSNDVFRKSLIKS
jgi:hypothetical protein